MSNQVNVYLTTTSSTAGTGWFFIAPSPWQHMIHTDRIPAALTDEDVCDAWSQVMHWRETGPHAGEDRVPPHSYYPHTGRVQWILVGIRRVSLDEYGAARSRLLRARVAASAERDRLSVLVDIQHEDEVW